MIQPAKIDAKVRQLVRKPDAEHPARAFANRLGAQNGKRSGSFGRHGGYRTAILVFAEIAADGVGEILRLLRLG